MRFNLSTFVLAVAASTGVMAAPVAEPEANAQVKALERRGPPIGKMLKNPAVISSVVTAVMSVLAGGKVLFTDFDEETDLEDEIEDLQQVPNEQYYQRPGVQPLVPAGK